MALILSLNQSIFQAVPGAGIAIGGLIAASAGPRVALGVGAIGSLGMALAMWLGLSVAARAPVGEHVAVKTADSDSALTAATGEQ